MKMHEALDFVAVEIRVMLAETLPTFSDDWWKLYVLEELTPLQRERVQDKNGDLRILDPLSLIRVVRGNARELRNAKRIGSEAKDLAFQLGGIRNRVSHPTAEATDIGDNYRDWDTIVRFLESIRASEKALKVARRERDEALAELAAARSVSEPSMDVAPYPMSAVQNSAAANEMTSHQSSDALPDAGNKLTKRAALQIAKERTGLSLSNRQSTFSNINSAKPCWWADPNVTVFNQEWFLLLNDQYARVLHFFRVPAGTFSPASQFFYIRPDNGRASIEVGVDDSRFFCDVKGAADVAFKQYLVGSFTY